MKPRNALLSAAIPSICYALIGTSPQLSVGPESLISVMTGIAVRSELLFDPTADAGEVASSLAMMCGLISVGLGLLQTGFVADVLSGYLLLGFIFGVSNLVMIQKLPRLIGLPIPAAQAVEGQSAILQLIEYIKLMPQAKLNTFFFGLSSVMFLTGMRYIRSKFKTKYPAALEIFLLVIASLALSYGLNLNQNYGIDTLGPFVYGLQTPKLPLLNPAFISRNLSLALTMVLFGFFDSIVLVRE